MKNTDKKPHRKGVIIFFGVFLAVFIPLLIYSNTHIDIESITIKSTDVPKAFDGTKIVLLSDYHNHGGKYDDKLLNIVKEAKPDYVFITGDIIDRTRTDVPTAEKFLKKVSETAPCYLVWGNHDKSLLTEDFEKLKNSLQSYGITILNGDTVNICKDNEYISLTGNYNYYDYTPCENEFNIWLNHFPENFEAIANSTAKDGNQVDLLFSGHAHGGLIRVPFGGGLIGHNGLFPEYTSGLYEYNGSYMIVSRGVGNSGPTLRLFNPFHVVICTLESEE